MSSVLYKTMLFFYSLQIKLQTFIRREKNLLEYVLIVRMERGQNNFLNYESQLQAVFARSA